MTVVLDTNVLIAAFATRGLCQSVFELCLDRHRIAISELLMQELKRGLLGKAKLPAELVVQIDTYVRSVGDLVEPVPLPVCARVRMPLQVHRKGDIGSPRDNGSTNRSNSSTTVGSIALILFLPPGGRRILPAGTADR